MIRFTATCQTETPLLSGGAVPRRVFELRPPGVKGALRFWWRAFHRFADDRQLHEAESRLFGGRIPGEGNQPAKALRSKFRIDVAYDPPRQGMLCLPAPLLPPGQRVWLKHRDDPNRDGFPSAPATAAYLLDLVQRGYGTGGSRREPMSSAFKRRQRLA